MTTLAIYKINNLDHENEVYFSETLDKEVKYLGQINLELEMKIFNSDWQPLFVLIDLNGKEIKKVNEVPLTEIMPKGFSSVRKGKRSI